MKILTIILSIIGICLSCFSLGFATKSLIDTNRTLGKYDKKTKSKGENK
jgi:hypothetical protein